MPKLHSSAAIISILQAHGFSLVSQKGSHQKYKNEKGRSVIVPAPRKEIPKGTLSSIIRQSGLARELFD